jgi:hypothetical protein
MCIAKDGVYMTISKITIVNRLDKEHVINIISKYGLRYDKYLIYDNVNYFIGMIFSKNIQ